MFYIHLKIRNFAFLEYRDGSRIERPDLAENWSLAPSTLIRRPATCLCLQV